MSAVENTSTPSPSPKPAPKPAAGRRRKPAMLFEVAWEVCSQVGGIYTVLRSKAPAITRRWGDNYCLIGPFNEHSARIELEPQQPTGLLGEAVARLEATGVQTRFGRWLVSGRPQVLLIDVRYLGMQLPEMKYLLWKDHGIQCPSGDYEFDDCVAFGGAAARFLRLVRELADDRPLLAHFHEWQAGAALPLLWKQKVDFATVFTTHATLVGRALGAADAEIYEHLSSIDPTAVAHSHGFGHRHGLERAAAHAADVFTTVSEITAQEARQFLGRAPDAVLPNGLNVERFATPHEFQEQHKRNKQRIHEFVMGHFFPSYTFDLNKTIYVFTAGRYEYRNKGIDVFIDALHRLNQRMKEENSPATVVAFIVTRAPYRSLNNETLNRQAMFDELHHTCEAIKEEIGQRLFRTVSTGRMPNLEDLIDEYASVRLKRMMHATRRDAPPTIVTHDLLDDAGDRVLNHLRVLGLWNMQHDRVKVVFHPEFITPTSPLLGMEYDEFVRGCHLGVFPSYYEPWGYTPMECVVRGVPAITSDLSGWGAYVAEHFPKHDQCGMYITPRRSTSFAESAQHVADWIHDIAHLTRRERVALRNRVEGHAEHFDWKRLSQHYTDAYERAFHNRYEGRRFVPPDRNGHRTAQPNRKKTSEK